MKTKKIILFFVITCLLLILFGCENSKVAYKDPETGEEKEITIEKTTNETEVADSLYALMLSDKEIKDTSKITLDVDFSVEIKDEKESISITGNIFSSINTNEEKITEDLSEDEINKLEEGYYKITFKGTNVKDGKEVKYSRSTIEEFVENGKSYLKIDIDENFLNTLEELFPPLAFEFQQIGDKVIYLDNGTLSSLFIPSLTNIDIDNIGDVLDNYGSITNDNFDYESLRAETEAMVKKLGVVITRVSGADVSYKFNLDSVLTKEYGVDLSDASCEVILTLNVAEFYLVDFKVNLENKDGEKENKILVEGDVSYKARITKISDKDKQNSVDGKDYLQDFLKKYVNYLYNDYKK